MRYTFVDDVLIEVRSGDGGAGFVGFRREKFLPFGGPNGGNGGRGGDVIAIADPQLATLLDYRFAPRQRAEAGAGGGSSQCTGRSGADCILRVPVGTVLRRQAEQPGEPELSLGDLDSPGKRLVVARGGRGGKGNEHFKSATRQAPDFAQPGEPGEGFGLRLTLKLLADVGLVGLPNVGKSSLLARISAARPKVAAYPFTTLVPNLGVVRLGDWQNFVVADVPGLVVGAAAGHGLGTRFLRHVERVRLLAHLVTADPGGDDDAAAIMARYDAIETEIHRHDPTLSRLPRLVVLNQIDLPAVAAQVPAVAALCQTRGLPFYPISAASGAGTRALIQALGQQVLAGRGPAAA